MKAHLPKLLMLAAWITAATLPFATSAEPYESPAASESSVDRWQLGDGETFVWKVGEDRRLPHKDFLEQGGRRAGQKVWYAIAADAALLCAPTRPEPLANQERLADGRPMRSLGHVVDCI